MKKRILFITRSLQFGVGGMQLYARTLIEASQQRPDSELQVLGYGGGRLGLPFFLLYAWLRSIFTCARFVHFGDAASAVFLPILRFLRPDLQLSVTTYGLDLVYPFAPYRWLLRRSLPHAHRVVCISRATAECARALGVESEKIVVILPALNPASLHRAPYPQPFPPCSGERELPVFMKAAFPSHRRVEGLGEGAQILLLGRQIRRKGTLWFLSEVLPKLLREIPRITVTIAGDGPELPAIRRAITLHHLEGSVRLLGCVTEADKERLYAQSTLFLMPNIPIAGDMEGFGLTCIEAASCGLPIIAARLEGVVDAVIESETGLFFRAEDSDDCVSAIRKALAIRWHPEAMREVCCRKFNVDAMLSSYLSNVWSPSTLSIHSGQTSSGQAGPPSVGFVTWDYDPPVGGMGRHVFSLVSGLRSAGQRASVFSRSDLRLPFGRSILFSLLLHVPLKRWLRNIRPDILHVHAGPGGVFLLLRPKNIQLIVTANHTYRDQVRFVGEGWKRLLIPFERRTYRLAGRILCLSQDTAFSLMHDYGIPESTLTVLPCGIDVAAFSRHDLPLASRVKRCVFVGRPDRRKGFDLLEAAWKIVAESVPDAVLHAVGIEGRSTEHITVESDCSDSALAQLLGSSRIVVCPSRLEGFGLVTAEAIAAGTPVVATDSPGLRSVVRDFETGLLTAPDPSEIAEKIIVLLTDDILWERLHAGCRKKRNAFDVSLEVERHLHMYHALLARRG